MGIGLYLRELREALGIKQYRCAQFCGMQPLRYKALECENFTKLPQLHELEAIAELYDVDPQELMIKCNEFLEYQRERLKK